MKTSLTYGAAMAAGGFALVLLLYVAGFHDSPEKMSVAQWVGSLGGLAIGIACLALAMREKRALSNPENDWGYGSALGAGLLTSVVSGALGLVSGWLYFSVINPGFSEVVLQAQLAAMEAKGMSAAQVAQAEPRVKKFTSPAVMTAFQGFFGTLWAVVLSLVVAIFFRRRDTPAPDVPPTL